MKGLRGLCVVFLLLLLLLPLLSLIGGGRDSPPQPAPPSSPQAPSGSSQPQKPVRSGFRILDSSTGKVVSVSDADFLPGAAAAEMSPLSKPEALKAQAVAAYTYYARLREQQAQSPSPELKGADFTADLSKGEKFVTAELMATRWGDKCAEYSGLLSVALKGLQNEALTYDGALIESTYYAMSSGQTESSEDIWGGKRSYLVAVASPGDAFASGFETKVVLTPAQLRSLLLQKAPKAALADGNEGNWLGRTQRTASGSVQSMEVGGQPLTGAELRTMLGLRSQNFTVTFAEGKFTFTVRGYGHGVGMSQVGAQYMAAQGATYREILAWYYPGTALETLK